MTSPTGPDDRAKVPDLRTGVRVPELDGLRGIAVLIVMIYHFCSVPKMLKTPLDLNFFNVMQLGWVGVDLFFVLSGFLITGILLDARDSSKHYFRSFYLRRVLRIFPLYYAYLLFFFLVLPMVVGSVLDGEKLAAFEALMDLKVWFAFYASNIWTFLSGEHTGLATSHFWTLAIEEQFYMVWPLVVFLCARKTLVRISVGVIAAALALRIGLAAVDTSPISIYVFTLTRIDTLLFGALLAIGVRSGLDPAVLAGWARRVLWVAAPLALVILWRGNQHAVSHVSIYTVGFTLVAASFTSLIALTVTGADSSRLSRVLRTRWLRFMGTYSYGLYVLHVIVYSIMTRVAGTPKIWLGTQIPWQIGFILVCSAISIVLALTSWHVMEKRFLALKKHFPY